jgi:hypothetical protein
MHYSCTSEVVDSAVIRYRVAADGAPVDFQQSVQLWQTDPDYRCFCSELLRSCEFTAYRWETPPYSPQTAAEPFEFVLVNYPSFVKRPTDNSAFVEHFPASTENSTKQIITFLNLSGDALLIVPTPQTSCDVYGHLAAFMRGAPSAQVDALWQTIGQMMVKRLSQQAIWLSTAGGGVAWLHVRIDRSPKYYAFAEYRRRP